MRQPGLILACIGLDVCLLPGSSQSSLQRLLLLSINRMLLLVVTLHLQSTKLSGRHDLKTCHMQEKQVFRYTCL